MKNFNIKILIPILLCFGSILCAVSANPRTPPDHLKLNEKLEAFRPLLGKTWKGTFKNSTPEKPVTDILRCERVLNGQGIKFIHSINNGVYGGETMFIVDTKTQKVVYYYFTTAGFMTVGTMEFEGNKMISRERVEGSSGGVSEVKAESELLPDGKLHVRSEHLKDGTWSPGHEVTYAEDPSAEVVFK